MSNFKNTSKGLVLLPILIMLSFATAILITLNQEFASHIFFMNELEQYLEAQKILPSINAKISEQLSSLPTTLPTPQAQAELLNTIETWPSIRINHQKIYIYHQLIKLNDKQAVYSSLINIQDTSAKKRLIYELISICTLAEHSCNPLQSTLL